MPLIELARRLRPIRLIATALLLRAGAVAFQASVPQQGDVVDVTLHGGESRTWQVFLNAGQFFQAVVDQNGIDVEVLLLAPDGRLVTRVDSPNRSYGPEPVVEIAKTSGAYQLAIRSPTREAAAGKLRLRIVAIREPTADDRARLAAERAVEQAQQQETRATAAERQSAIETYRQALAYFETDGDRYRQALIVQRIGIIHFQLGDSRSAIECQKSALRGFHSVADPRLEASALNNLAVIYDSVGEVNQALLLYEQALLLLRESGEAAAEANALNNIGTLYVTTSNWQRALEFFFRALPLLRMAGDHRREANTLHNVGLAYYGLSEFATALGYLEQALTMRIYTGDRAGEADTLQNLGVVHARLGHSESAVAFCEKALAVQLALGDRRGQARALSNLGLAQLGAGRVNPARSALEQAIEKARSIGDLSDEAVSLGRLAVALSSDPAKAHESYEQAFAAFESLGDRSQAARMLIGMAQTERALGKTEDARRHVAAATDMIEQTRTRAGVADTRASYFASTRDGYDLYIDLLMEQHDPRGAFEISERARARSLLEMLNESQTDIREGVEPALLQREQELRNLIQAKTARLRPGANDLKTEISRLQDEYDRLEAEIREKSPRYAALTQPKTLSFADTQAALDGDSVLLEYWLGAKRSWLWAVTRESVSAYELLARDRIEPSARRVSDLLSGHNDRDLPAAARELSGLILDPAAADLGNRRIVVAADGALEHVPFAMLPAPGDSGETPLIVRHEVAEIPSASAVAELRKQIGGRPRAPRQLAVFADPVFDTSDPRLKSSGAAEPVLTAQNGSADRLLVQLAESAGQSAAPATLIPRLPYTRQEAQAILPLAPAASRLAALDFRASRDAALDPGLRQYRYLHFATHGFVDNDHPGLSSLVLSMVDAQGRPANGFLRLTDIYNMKLAADLVTLSACQTGLGKQITGEGVLGLTRGFLYAGAARVIVSLWSVNDRATAELMTRFYRHLLKDNQTPAASLRAAQVEMWQSRQWKSPYYWAAFVQHGEWR
jgi:CHAT domain-containing protein/tetratricopeptide (TPR) repeat protein